MPQQSKDYRFGVARREPIDPAHKELARALLAEAANADPLMLLRALRKLSKNRRKSKGDTGPYLDIRQEDGRKDKVVVIDGNFWESTRIDAVAGQAPEDNVDALIYFQGYVHRANLQAWAEEAPGDVSIPRVLDEYVEAHRPDEACGVREMNGLSRQDKLLALGDPMKWWAQQKNAVHQLKEFFAEMTLGDITRDSGKEYKSWRQKRPKLVGGMDQNGAVRSPKDKTVRRHLYVLKKAIDWFLDNCKEHNVRVVFEMPKFEKTDPYSLDWKEFIKVLLVCRGLVPCQDGFMTKTVLLNGVARQVWDKDWIADRETMRAVERYIKIYFLSGTRDKSIVPLTWSASDWHGWIDIMVGFIHRNGRKSIRHKQKPRETSELLPFVVRIFRNWWRMDKKKLEAGVLRSTHPDRGPQDWVMHDRHGNPIHNMEALSKAVFERAGIGTKKKHTLKNAGVSAHFKRGFGITQIANIFGTDEDTLRESYLSFNWSAERISPEATKNVKSWADLGGRIVPFRRIALQG